MESIKSDQRFLGQGIPLSLGFLLASLGCKLEQGASERMVSTPMQQRPNGPVASLFGLIWAFPEGGNFLAELANASARPLRCSKDGYDAGHLREPQLRFRSPWSCVPSCFTHMPTHEGASSSLCKSGMKR